MSRTITLLDSLHIPSTLITSVISDDPTLDNAFRPFGDCKTTMRNYQILRFMENVNQECDFFQCLFRKW